MLVYIVWALPFVLWMLQSYVARHPARPRGGGGRRRRQPVQILYGIVAPLLAPGIVVTTLFAFITRLERVLLRPRRAPEPELPTLPLRLAQFVGLEGIVRLGPLAASALLATLPSLLLFVVIQRWLTRGLLSGAVKG